MGEAKKRGSMEERKTAAVAALRAALPAERLQSAIDNPKARHGLDDEVTALFTQVRSSSRMGVDWSCRAHCQSHGVASRAGRDPLHGSDRHLAKKRVPHPAKGQHGYQGQRRDEYVSAGCRD